MVLGLCVQFESVLDVDMCCVYFGQVMFYLMVSDCGGMVSFGNNFDGMWLDKFLLCCWILWLGVRVVVIGGQLLVIGDLFVFVVQVVVVCCVVGEVMIDYVVEDGQLVLLLLLVCCNLLLLLLFVLVYLVVFDV